MEKNKKEYMSDETFSELMKATGQALAYERGLREDYRVTQVAVSRHAQPVSGKQEMSRTGRYRAMRYKGYNGRFTLDEDANIFYGEVINARDVITFQGASQEECRQAFRDSVDDYLEFCRGRGEEPSKPF